MNLINPAAAGLALAVALTASAFVSLPYNTRRSDVDRFRALRAGDYVRVEGRFLDRERFELESFI